MCGIVGAVSNRNITPVLLHGLNRLEYRGYDSAGIAVVDNNKNIQRVRAVGKIKNLESALLKTPADGFIGIGHTRWATHGEPTEKNAHPHVCNDCVAIVHNGIIENHESLRAEQIKAGFNFTSDTDTEVIVHQIEKYLNEGNSLFAAVKKSTNDLDGAYALGVVSTSEPETLICARKGSPLVIGVGENENFIASDMSALLSETHQFIILKEGDMAIINASNIDVFDEAGDKVDRDIHESKLSGDAVDKGEYAHYMLKEIYEQPAAIAETLEARLGKDTVLDSSFGPKAIEIFNKIKSIQIIACGTSYHAGLIAKYGIESVTNLPCNIEVASEFRYRTVVVQPDTLLITISQSGETADTLAALRKA
ncbi:MAG: glutamine--fructose-6-phosphate transaminase (isomerizing), partial [Gammaproteobacteria bacterium]|nr:glutamine--fructose-6-phosphate transaminase (isomerizing) [Gammaproteobacteria bacterium]